MKKLMILLAAATIAGVALPGTTAQAAPQGNGVMVRHLQNANHRLHKRIKHLRHRLHAKGKHGHKAA